MNEDPDAPRCFLCKNPGHEVPDCYIGANIENRPPKGTLTEFQQKLIEQYQKSNKHKNPRNPKPSTSKDLN